MKFMIMLNNPVDKRLVKWPVFFYRPVVLIFFFFFSLGNLIGRNNTFFSSSIFFADTLSIYNVFSPNDDGVNDNFNFVATGATEVKGVIFNRWGVKVLEWNSQQSWWDGRSSSGLLLPEGTYFYVIDAKYPGETINKKGFVFLIR